MRIISQVGHKLSAKLAELLPEDVVVEVAPSGPVGEFEDAAILLTQTWGSENIAAVVEHGVQWIHTLGTGVDRFPFDAVGERTVTCSRGASSIPIAEFVLAAMLAFEKQIPEVFLERCPERWFGARLGGLYGKTLGLVGMGGIALAVAERALPFGVQVIATRRRPIPSPLADVRMVELADLVARADHIVVAAAATEENRQMFDDALFSKMKRGAHFINVARGVLVDQDALRRALDSGVVARASLDTMQPEPLPDGHWMYDHAKVRLTPHVSWSMPGAVDLLLDKFVANVELYRRGEALNDVVRPGQGY